MKILFIHRSVGQQLIDSGAWRSSLRHAHVYDLNANTNLMIGPDGTPATSSLNVPGGNTNPDGLSKFFSLATDSFAERSELASFDLIAFKSCYSASDIRSAETLSAHKRAYQGSIESYVRIRPECRFLIISPPPRRPVRTSKSAAARATAFSKWLGDFASSHSNCEFYDLFGQLSNNGVLLPQFRRALPYDQHPNEAGATLAGVGLAEKLSSMTETSRRE
jgi:hypothetical protein